MARFVCKNCKEDWATVAMARSCCSTCDHFDFASGTTCGARRTWSAPIDDYRYPLGYCPEHTPKRMGERADA